MKPEAKRQLHNCSDFYVKGQAENFVSIQTPASSNQLRSICTHRRRIRSSVRRSWMLLDFSTHCKTARTHPEVVQDSQLSVPLGENNPRWESARILNEPSASISQPAPQKPKLSLHEKRRKEIQVNKLLPCRVPKCQ